MTDPAAPIVAGYLDGTLTAEAAAAQLHALLTSGTDLSLAIDPQVVPLFEALHRLISPGTPFELPPAPPVVWGSQAWGDLSRTPDDIWPLIEQGTLQQVPVCLDYSFRVGSEAALQGLESWLRAHTDHTIRVERPPSFRHFHAIVRVQTRPQVLTREDLVTWARGLAALPVFAEVSPEGLGLTRPG